MGLYESIARNDVYFIAEMSGNHGGSLEGALEIVRSAAEAGANCLKIQTFTPDTITLNCANEDFMTRKGLWEGRTLYDLYTKAYTPWEWQGSIKEECERLGMDFLSSVFDDSSVDFLETLNVEAYKIASPELVDLPLIRYAARTGKPLIISCGMGTEDEIRRAVDACKREGNDKVVLLKCTSEYPAVYEDMNIATIPDMAQRFGCPVGLSDHSMGYAVDVAAAVIGACVIEKHFCLSRQNETVDSAFSMEPQEFADMIEAVRNARAAMGKATYERTPREEAGVFGRRSIYACAEIKPGDTFSDRNVKIVRPSMGLDPRYWDELIGKRSSRHIDFGGRLTIDDLHEDGLFQREEPFIKLRTLKEGDQERTFEWVTQPWYTEEFAGRAKPTRESHAAYFDNLKNDASQKYFAIECDGVHIGNAGLKYFEGDTCECWYYIGDTTYRGKGLSPRVVAQLVDYAFSELGIDVVKARIQERNVASVRAVTKNGFVLTNEPCQDFKGNATVVYAKFRDER